MREVGWGRSAEDQNRKLIGGQSTHYLLMLFSRLLRLDFLQFSDSTDPKNCTRRSPRACKHFRNRESHMTHSYASRSAARKSIWPVLGYQYSTAAFVEAV